MGKKKCEIDGKRYDSFDDLPEDCKKLLEDKNQNNIPDIFEGNEKKIIRSETIIERKKFNNINELPEEIRKKIEKDFSNKINEDVETENADLLSSNKDELRNVRFGEQIEKKYHPKDHFQPTEPVTQYCDNCGNVLPDKSFLGYVKCESCGKRMKKKM